ncbi:hypothetical protein GCM10011369_23110 [Neiella marina]|uniref:Pyocin activator protein PrtN n=1 Tax=Neiella marina TaxID=508461 RepID=A0A8J2XPJ2_9GAMM|nr:pyocin activator PrtN family protein [Neiella marina]GGA80560.1 hypothetical protein GCM10011369_23110 [Neiella marina]
MKTALLLMAQYEKTTIPLEDICEEYFACSRHTAIQKAKASTLPVPAFQVGKGNKAPWFVHVDDLAQLIDKQRSEAKSEWGNAA